MMFTTDTLECGRCKRSFSEAEINHSRRGMPLCDLCYEARLEAMESFARETYERADSDNGEE